MVSWICVRAAFIDELSWCDITQRIFKNAEFIRMTDSGRTERASWSEIKMPTRVGALRWGVIMSTNDVYTYHPKDENLDKTCI